MKCHSSHEAFRAVSPSSTGVVDCLYTVANFLVAVILANGSPRTKVVRNSNSFAKIR